MKKETEVSVIMPCFNGEKFVARAIESVQKQSNKDWELIIFNDGSKDNSKKEIKRFLWDKRIKFFSGKSNKGISFARNFAIKKSSGKFLAFLDCDDYWLEKKLEITVKALKESKKDFAFTDFFIKKQGKPLKLKKIKITLSESGKENLEKLVMHNFIPTSTVVFEKKLLMNDKFDEKLKYGTEDCDLWLRLFPRSKPLHIGKPLTVWENHENNTTSNVEKKVKEHIFMIKRFAEDKGPLKKAMEKDIAFQYHCLARAQHTKGNFQAAKENYEKSFEKNPHIKTIIAMILCAAKIRC